ncbi:MAG: GNAT family N-acetyltransferase [Archangium sp.]|nr:GNAT family N-acetyltransferase [Archangium sp.]
MSTSDVRIREAVAADDAAVGELLVESFVTRYARKMPDVVVTPHRKDELRDVASKREIAKVWVAEVVGSGKIVGTVALWPPGAHRSESWISGAADLRHLAVDGSQAGKGVSKLLIDAAENFARAAKWKGVCLHVRRGAHGVRRIYEQRGYVRREEGDLDFLPEVFLEAFYLALT